MLNNKNPKEIFGRKIFEDFHQSFEKHNPFAYDKEYYKRYYNLFCAGIHRINSCVKYLENHWEYPQTEEDFIAFIVFADILFEAIRNTFKCLDLNLNDYQSDDFFGNVEIPSPRFNGNSHNTNDGEFFKYFRALAVAHSFGTEKQRKFLADAETQYSPHVIVGEHLSYRPDEFNIVGALVYSNLKEKITCFKVSMMVTLVRLRSHYLFPINSRISSDTACKNGARASCF